MVQQNWSIVYFIPIAKHVYKNILQVAIPIVNYEEANIKK
jgi:hypothetical protein